MSQCFLDYDWPIITKYYQLDQGRPRLETMEDVGFFWLAWPSYERRSSSTRVMVMPGSVGYDRAVMVAVFDV